jgi:hypothetical protein
VSQDREEKKRNGVHKRQLITPNRCPKGLSASDRFRLDTPTGGAGRAMGQEMGDKKAQAKQSLQSKLAGTAETAGITGAQIPGAIAGALPAVIPSTIGGLKAIGAWGDAHVFTLWFYFRR